MSVNVEDVELLNQSGLLDPKWYTSEYPDVVALGMSAATHYLKFGARLLRDPGPEFRTRAYLQAYPDVVAAGINPLVHYLAHGKEEGREEWRSRAQSSSGEPSEHAVEGNCIIRSSRPGVPPDLFTVRTSHSASRTVVVSFESSADHSRATDSYLLARKDDFDRIQAFPASRLDVGRPQAAGKCNRFFSIGYPEGFGEAASLLHLLIGGVLSRYDEVVWLRPAAADHLSTDARVEPATLLQRADVGVIASEIETVDLASTDDVRRVINTLLPRLNRQQVSGKVRAPGGAVVVINGLLLRQLAAFDIRVQDFAAADASGRDRSRAILECLLGVLADEGDLAIRKLGEFAAAAETPSRSKHLAKTIAFFLPQFHPIAENDQWWGKGFTEWSNVVRAKPLFRSHHQPRLPADLGFYDLRLPKTQEAQAELARKHGVHGFCYYYYWFDGKKLLNEPIEQMLRSGKPDFPFCVCWANENWSRNWDGQNRHVLLEQSYSRESNLALIREFIPMMKDSRYIRHNGKPVLIVYRIKVIPNWLETAKMWRDECRKAGLGEIHLCAVRFGLEPLEGAPQDFGLDAYVLFPPHETVRKDVRSEALDLHPDFKGELFCYDAVVNGDLERFGKGYPWPVHRGAMMGWDNTARRLTDARIFKGATPLRFRAWLSGILEQEETFNRDEDSLLFINAWNEWAEGTVLEPDRKFGTGYLEAVRSALAASGRTVPDNMNSISQSNAVGGARPIRSTAVRNGAVRPTCLIGNRQRVPKAPTVLLCAHISGHQLFGGERSFLDVLHALCDMSVNVVVTLPSMNNPKYVDEVRAMSVRVYGFPYPQWKDNRPIDESLCLIFGDIIAAENVDLVHANTIVLLEPLVAAKRLGRRALIHARELISLDESLRERIGLSSQEIIRQVFARTNYIIANSHATARTFCRAGKTFYVPNAVDMAAMDLPNEVGAVIRFGIVSSNIPKKGVEDFVAVAGACHGHVDNAQFVVVGPKNAQIEKWECDVREGRLPSNLKFLGYRETPRDAMREVDVLLNLSSFAESFGRTVAEAMAARRPVIAYEWGALPELISHGETGYLAPYRDIGSVAAHVIGLCQSPERVRVMGERAREVIGNGFSREALRRHLGQAYDKILDTGAPTNRNILPKDLFTPEGGVSIVVPVFNAHDEVSACLASLRRHADLERLRVIVIDDGSTDPRIGVLLEEYKVIPGFCILRNPANLGYTKTVNRGIREAGSTDVVLLNSDAIATPNWLSGLRACAYSRPRIGTVTAMSDNAGAFSFPIQGKKTALPDGVSVDEFALRVVDHTAGCEPVEVPTGSGFCMYIRRQLIDSLGLFDEEAFPRGYGEENDFCMRALKNGWKNVVSPWSYVFHVRTASFGGEKEKLVRAGVDVVTRRYPDYAKRVNEAFSSVQMTALRAAATRAVEAILKD